MKVDVGQTFESALIGRLESLLHGWGLSVSGLWGRLSSLR